MRLARLKVSLFVLAIMMVSVAATFAQTPTPVPSPTSGSLVTSATGVFTNAGVAVIVFATAIISLGTMLYRKFRGASR